MALVSVVLSRAFNTPLVPFVHLDTGREKEKKVKAFVSLGLKQFKHDFTSVP